MRPVPDPGQLAGALRSGQYRALARAITLIESGRSDHRDAAAELLEQLLPDTGKALRIGISGVPGVGKSTFIEALGMYALELGQKVAVLSIDPSSSISGGSILGDKTRMEKLAREPRAVIRPSPAGHTLGGVARRTRETLLLCEAAGFDTVIVETVGVGQSETAVAGMTDMFILLLLPGGGDELQGIKRGIMELADLVLINKADGELLAAARRAAADYRNALRLLQPRSPDWQVPVEMCSALTGDGIADAWQTILDYQQALSASGEIERRRARQSCAWLWQETADNLLAQLNSDPDIRRRLP
jgi:LAO/AO transport system kinase